jgi:hypothetical protein
MGFPDFPHPENVPFVTAQVSMVSYTPPHEVLLIANARITEQSFSHDGCFEQFAADAFLQKSTHKPGVVVVVVTTSSFSSFKLEFTREDLSLTQPTS